MPVIVPAQRGTPLSQGDVLDRVSFATSSVDGNIAADSSARYTLVVSRPCRALREPHVIVAPVRPMPLDLGKVLAEDKKSTTPEKLDRMRRLLAAVRDGGQLTDHFYLGTLEPGSNQRFGANLSVLSTQRLPEAPAERQRWVDEHRIAALEVEFARDLHVRLFNSFARLGFDDHRWFSDADLALMIISGQQEINAVEAQALEAAQAIQRTEAEGKNPPKKQRDEAANKQEEVKAAKAALEPYLAEQARRKA